MNGDISNAMRFPHDMDGPHLAVFRLKETVYSAYCTIPKDSLVKLCGTHWNGSGGLHDFQSIVKFDVVDDYSIMNVIREVSVKKLVFGYHTAERKKF